jgi:DNA-binding NarL/FixJ family response regulator
VEGHVDEAIARRLGMNVRTCRAHIAKLAQALGSGSRAQLGYLIAQSGMLNSEDAPAGPEG